MTTRDLIDPEVYPAIDAMPQVDLNDIDLPRLRAFQAKQYELENADARGVERRETIVPGKDGSPPVRCLIYAPKNRTGLVPAYLHLHGGGYIVGAPEMSDLNNVRLCSELGIIVVSVDYRLAPEHPFPAALEDAYASLAYLFDTANELGVDKSRIGFGGESAGGGLAATLSLHARDKGEFNPIFQVLIYPMIDDRTGSECDADPLVGEFVWTRDYNKFGWDAYLGSGPRSAPAAAARAEDLKGLPEAWIFTAQFDLFRDENLDYAQRLMKAGVQTELSVFPRTMHGFQGARDSKVSMRFYADVISALRRGLRTN